MIKNLTGKSGLYKAVFFDLDGTLTDSGEGCVSGVKYMLSRIGHPQLDEKSLRAFVGPPTKKYLVSEYGFSQEEARRAYAFYREYYDSKGIFENRLYDGIKEALNHIRSSGKALYVATSKPEALAHKVLERFGIDSVFSGVFAARHELGIYEKSEVLEYAVRQLGEVPRSVMVGDRRYDIIGAKHVGFDAVGVLYGYGDEAELIEAGCDYTAESPEDLAALLGGKE